MEQNIIRDLMLFLQQFLEVMNIYHTDGNSLMCMSIRRTHYG